MQFEKLQIELREFAKERDWEQFHSPKNLAMALAVEASELMEIFQWVSEEESKTLPSDLIDSVAQEIADVQIYLARIADVMGIDIENAVKAIEHVILQSSPGLEENTFRIESKKILNIIPC